MKSLDKNFIFIILLFLASGLITWNLYYKTQNQRDSVNIHSFPKIIGDWRAEEIAITEEEYQILETRNAFTRKYTNSKGQEIYLFIVYSQYNRKVSHPPEICYIGSGVTILSNDSVFFTEQDGTKIVKANRLLMEYKHSQQLAYYWFKVGNTFTSNYWQQQILIGLKHIFGRPESSALIRIAAKVDGQGTQETSQMIQEFAQFIIPVIYTFLP